MRVAPLVLIVLATACSFDWDDYDPRLSGAGGTGGSSMATGGGGGIGGAVGGQGGMGGSAPDAWGDVRLVEALSSAVDEDDPSFTADLLEVFFNRDDPDSATHGDIFVSTRGDVEDPWGTPTLVAELSTSEHEQNVVVSPDGLTIWFSRMGDIYVSMRGVGTAWSVPLVAADLSTVDPESMSAVTDDMLYAVVTRRVGGAIQDLFVHSRGSSADAWGAPMPIDELNSAAVDSQAWVSPDGLSIFFTTTRDTGFESIFSATRTAALQPWDAPSRVEELSSTEERSDPWVSPDGRYMLFAQGSYPDRDIYEARR